jgi:hypothetical protein
MAWILGKYSQGAWDSLWDSDAPIYLWNLPHSAGVQGVFPVLGSPGQGDSEPTDGTPAALAIAGTPGQGHSEPTDGNPAALAIAGTPGYGDSEPTDGNPAPLAIAGTPGPDVFVLDKTTLAAATAVPPSFPLIPDYKASEGDLIDFSSLSQVSYAPLPADAVQLRVAEDASAAFATLQLNVGSVANPFWTTVAQLDGLHAGDAVHVSLDATHTVHLSAGWLV